MVPNSTDDRQHYGSGAGPGHGAAVGAPDPRDRGPGPGRWEQPAYAADPFGASRRVLSARRRQRWWVVALWVLATIILALAAVTIGVSIRHSSTGSSPPAATGTSSPHAGTGTPPSTTGAPGTPGGPTIASLTPDQGPVGQSVAIAGTGLMSSDGQVLAHFGAVVAPTACPTTTSCTATAPPGPAPGTQVPVTVSTAGGTSNSLTYTYR